MGAEQLIASYSWVGDLITIITCAVLLFIIAKVLYYSKDRKFVFLKRSLRFILVGVSCNIGFYHMLSVNSDCKYVIYLLRDIYHCSLLCCLYCFLLYMKYMLDIKGKVVEHAIYLTRFSFVVCIILDILSPLTKMGLHMDNGEWNDSMISSYNFFYVYTIISLAAVLIFYSNRLIRSVRVCLIATDVVVVLIMIYQIFLDTNAFSGFTYLLPILVVLITLHSKPFDDKTGSLSSSSFNSFIEQVNRKNISVDYLVLKLYMSIAEQVPDELGKVLNSFWHGAFKDATLFDLSNNLYVLAIPRNAKNGNSENKIDYLIRNYFEAYYNQYKFTYKIVELLDVDFIENVSDILGVLKYILQIMEDNSKFVLDDNSKKNLQFFKFLRANLIEMESEDNLDDPRVLVYCQPIRNMKTGKYDTAEALMRLELPQYGIVMPGMFIELAEQYNHIHALTRVMINKVCKQIRMLEDEGYEFERISVNIAASEIKEDGFCDEILGIIKSNGVEPSKIGIELTESQTERDFMIIKRKMKTLREAGMTLYLDDVGTGYSNLDRIVHYDVDVVKFDRFFLLEAEKSMKIVKMITHLSQAFRDMDYKLLFEGVETEAHETLCMGCGADYIQGFKYSKPVPIEELREYFECISDVDGERKHSSSVKTDKYEKEMDALSLTEHTEYEMAFKLLNPLDYPEKMRSLVMDFNHRAQRGNELYLKVCQEIEDAKLNEKMRHKEMMDQYGILLTMSKLFYSMHVIDLVNNTVKPYNPTEDVNVKNVVNSSVGADVMMRQIMSMCTIDEHVDEVLKFSDLSTVAERMKGKKLLTAEYIGKSIGWYVAAFYTIETDEEGRPTKVVYTTRSIDDTKPESERMKK